MLENLNGILDQEHKVHRKQNMLKTLADINTSNIFVVALTKRDKNNLKKATYEVIINLLLILNKEQKKISKNMHCEFQKKKTTKVSSFNGGEVNEIDILKKKHKCLFFPKDSFSRLWNSLISIILIYVTFALSFELAFIEETNLFFQLNEYITSAIFILDIFYNFNAAFINQHGNIVVSRKEIVIRYMKCWFWVDFISSFPFFLLTNSGTESLFQGIKTIKIFKYLKIVRILRLLKFVKRFFPQHLKNRSSKNHIKFKSNSERMTQHLFFALIFAHCFSCIFYSIPVFFSPQVNWVKLRNLEVKTALEKYFFSLHWMIETMITVGFGENSFQ